MYRKELLKGSTETLLLSLLANRSLYGYSLVKEIARRSQGYFLFKEGTLYPALHRMERDGLISGQWRTTPGGQRRKYYVITEKGRKTLEELQKEWSSFSRAVNLVVEVAAAQSA